MFVIDNQTKFSYLHGCHTINRKQLHVPNANFSAFQKVTMFTAIKLLNRLPKTIQSLKEVRISFKMNLFLYFMNNSSYTVPEFVEHNINN
jgi:hypothetical protein